MPAAARTPSAFASSLNQGVANAGTLTLTVGPLLQQSTANASVGHATTGQVGTLQFFASADGATFVKVAPTVATTATDGGSTSIPVCAPYMRVVFTNTSGAAATVGTYLFLAATNA